MVNVNISSPVNPSESEELVLDAIMRIFPDASLSRTPQGFEGTAPGIENFSLLIRRQRVLDAARSVIYGNLSEDLAVFCLNKQAASVGKVSFCPKENVLGTIEVRLEGEELSEYIDGMLPRTVDGQEVIL
ncbi:MAG TPA: hypothetical protein VJX93_00435 [Candidatus Methanomethylophilaceae archaeon]|nr:hypothetical protein [Candidatus Methanomethylophilaceae archaeon]